MIIIIINLLIVFLICAYFLGKKFLQKKKMKDSFDEGLKKEWVEILENKMSLYKILPQDMKDRLHGHINYFLETKSFYGHEGLEITEEIKVTVAGDACLPVLMRKKPIYPNFKNIFICPELYIRTEHETNGDVVDQVTRASSGVSWLNGPLLLAWKYASYGSSNKTDGENVTLHEFAHKLDGEDGATNGLPILRNKKDYDEWYEVMTREYANLCDRVDRRANRVLDEYGATNPAEFFAVATEAFFEKSVKFKKKLPELYALLAKYYELDPAQWHLDYRERLRLEKKAV